jgi:hypothetical protein
MPKNKVDSNKKTYGLRLDQGLMKDLQYLGVDENRWMNDLVEEAIKDLLKKYRERKKPER